VLPDPVEVLEATLGPAAGVVALDGVHVVRTAGRGDHAPGNAVHHLTDLPAGGLAAAVADLDRRFPTGRARLVVPHDPELVAAVDATGLRPSTLEVVVRDAGAGTATPRGDLRLSVPSDDRAWHGITVLHRHVAPPGEDRGRGAEDDRLKWWVDGLRELVAHGRARVLRAERFGTPVGVGVLHWAPGVEVGADHAGLAVVAGVTVHPAHRGLGVARALADTLVEQHLAGFPRARVAAVAERHGDPGTTSPAVPSGWQPHARLLALTRS
jgi:GNAT superfamily N-acetyltransferase